MVGSEDIYLVGEACANVQVVLEELVYGRTLLGLEFIYSPYSIIYFIYCMNGSATTRKCQVRVAELTRAVQLICSLGRFCVWCTVIWPVKVEMSRHSVASTFRALSSLASRTSGQCMPGPTGYHSKAIESPLVPVWTLRTWGYRIANRFSRTRIRDRPFRNYETRLRSEWRVYPAS